MMHISLTDKINVVRKLVEHRIVARELRRPEGAEFFRKAEEAFETMAEQHGETMFVRDWRQIMRLGREEVAKLIVSTDDRMAGLRDSSPLLRVWGYKFGENKDMDFRDEALRRRLWRVATRIANIKPLAPEASQCTVPTLT